MPEHGQIRNVRGGGVSYVPNYQSPESRIFKAGLKHYKNRQVDLINGRMFKPSDTHDKLSYERGAVVHSRSSVNQYFNFHFMYGGFKKYFIERYWINHVYKRIIRLFWIDLLDLAVGWDLLFHLLEPIQEPILVCLFHLQHLQVLIQGHPSACLLHLLEPILRPIQVLTLAYLWHLLVAIQVHPLEDPQVYLQHPLGPLLELTLELILAYLSAVTWALTLELLLVLPLVAFCNLIIYQL